MDRRKHLSVIGLVAITVIFSRFDVRGEAFSPVRIVRAANGNTLVREHIIFVLDPAYPDQIINRNGAQIAAQPTPEPTPLPTPVAPPPPPVETYAVPVVGNGMLLWPVPDGHITQYFSSYHPALDIAAPAGRSVLAADAGTVTWIGWKDNGGGLQVYILHGNGVKTYYNHLGSIEVALGDVVTRGQVIAAVGCTGNCTGPHVHFVVVVNGVFIDPLLYL